MVAREFTQCDGYRHASEAECIARALATWEEDGKEPGTTRHFFYPQLGDTLLLDAPLEQGEEELKGGGQRAYKWFAHLLSLARKDGRVPWEMIYDPGRRSWTPYSYPDAERFFYVARYLSCPVDIWRGQPRRLLITIEKEGLFSLVKNVADQYDVPVRSTKGYASTTAIKDIAKDIGGGRGWTVMHVGDFDPSGLAIDRAIRNELRDVHHCRPQFVRIALTQPQTRTLPANAALELKSHDSRIERFKVDYGPDQKGFEIESMPTRQLQAEVEKAIRSRMDLDALNGARELRDAFRAEHQRRMADHADGMRDWAFGDNSPLYRDFGAAFTDLYLYYRYPEWTPGQVALPQPEPWRGQDDADDDDDDDDN